MRAFILSLLLGVHVQKVTINIVNDVNQAKQEKEVTIENNSDFPLLIGNKAFNCQVFTNYRTVYTVKCRDKRKKMTMSATGIVNDRSPLYLHMSHYQVNVYAE